MGTVKHDWLSGEDLLTQYPGYMDLRYTFPPGTTGRALEELTMAIRGVGNAFLEELIEKPLTKLMEITKKAITRINGR